MLTIEDRYVAERLVDSIRTPEEALRVMRHHTERLLSAREELEDYEKRLCLLEREVEMRLLAIELLSEVACV